MAKYIENGWIITQIGSLPLSDPKKAVEYSLQHDIPFLPELPLLGEGMLSYIRRPGSLVCLGEFKRHEFVTVKVQAVGPAIFIFPALVPVRPLYGFGNTWSYPSELLRIAPVELLPRFLPKHLLDSMGPKPSIARPKP